MHKDILGLSLLISFLSPRSPPLKIPSSRGFAHLSAQRCCFKTLGKHSGCRQLLLKVLTEQKHAWSSVFSQCQHSLLCVTLQKPKAALFLIACEEVKITI